MSWESHIEKIIARHQELTDHMATGQSAAADFVAMSQEYAEISPLVEKINQWKNGQREIADLQEMTDDPDMDAEMRALALLELQQAKKNQVEMENALQYALIPSNAHDSRNAILEIRAGTGGDEAALFAADLFRMYHRYAQDHRWQLEVIDSSQNDLGGMNQIIMAITGQNVFARLKFESGVHRVQRVPTTESGGRIHTSAATVAVLPEAKEVDITLDQKDLRIDTYRAQGAGGQHVNTTDSAVRITHIPTGVVVQCQDEKSQHKNRAKAMKVLMARLYDHASMAQDLERAADRKNQVGSGDRSERIRTYNFPQGRVTDHRINLTLYKLERIISGEGLDEVIEALIVENQVAQLADLAQQ